MVRPSEAPLISVVIASYNSGRYLEDAVRSAMGQTVAEIEILIADDLSSDDSPQIAQRLAQMDARVRFIPAQRNTGPAGARNRALAAARGVWVAILDSDDLMHPSRLEQLLQAADALGADMVADDLVVFDHDVAGKAARFLQRPESDAPFELTPRRYCAQTVMYGRKPNLGFLKPMIRRAAMQAIDLRYDEHLRIGEDDDLVLRALAGGLRYWVVPGLTYFYRKHGQSISHRSNVADLQAMADASDRIAGLFPGADPATRRAIARRAHATHDALAFEHVIDALKGRRVAAALAGLLRHPRAALLLRLPLAVRLMPKKRAGPVSPMTLMPGAPLMWKPQ